MTTKLTFDGDWCATVTNDPLRITPRFVNGSVDLVHYGDVKERERFLADTFGSQDHLWDAPDVLRFDRASRDLVGAEFHLPEESDAAKDTVRGFPLPAVRPGGLRADEVRDFRHERCTVLHRAPGDTVLTCLRDLDVLGEPLEARIGVAPDMALLVQHGAAVGWSLTDPARHLTTAYTDPEPAPPAPATRRLLTECLDLISESLVYDLLDAEPAALARLRAADEALRNQREDRHRAEALLQMIATHVEDYGNW
ncbi:hypothetical protein ACFWIB_08040 [Streptomyces sp. NPDC127051]|uniref:hypothetical protein n=1 Tax=Streptomyces sp. NPDC127051 TaxID=3347119 RepID=UPI003662A904